MELENEIISKETCGQWDESKLAVELAVGGFSSWKAFDTRPYKRTGTKKGWSEPPPLSKIAAEDEIEDNEFFSLEDLADIQRPTLGECFYDNQYI